MKKKEHISTVLCSTLCRKKKEEYCSRLFVYKSIHLNRCAAWSLLYCCRRSIKRIDFRLWLNTKYRHPTHYKYTYKNIQSIVFFSFLQFYVTHREFICVHCIHHHIWIGNIATITLMLHFILSLCSGVLFRLDLILVLWVTVVVPA